MELENFLSICTVIIANLGTVLALYLQSDKKIDESRKETNDLIRSIQMEIKDFHGRLEKQDAEFKSHIIYLHKEGNKS